jgi:hypothetical protein
MTPTRAAQYFIRRLPFFLLLVKGVLLGLFLNGVDTGALWYVSELQGHSLAFVAVLAYYAYIGRHCFYLWVCIVGLAALNTMNIIYYFVAFNYYELYAAAVILTALLITLIYAIRRTRRSK